MFYSSVDLILRVKNSSGSRTMMFSNSLDFCQFMMAYVDTDKLQSVLLCCHWKRVSIARTSSSPGLLYSKLQRLKKTKQNSWNRTHCRFAIMTPIVKQHCKATFQTVSRVSIYFPSPHQLHCLSFFSGMMINKCRCRYLMHCCSTLKRNSTSVDTAHGDCNDAETVVLHSYKRRFSM